MPRETKPQWVTRPPREATRRVSGARDQIAPDLRKLAAFLDARTTIDTSKAGDPARRTLTGEQAAHPARQTLAFDAVAAGVSPARTEVHVSLHHLGERLDPRLHMYLEPTSARAAAYRVLGHRLKDQGDPRVIAVSSAGRREGKTTLAVNLALALSEAGRARVLLLDTCVRYPAMARVFGFQPPWCFAAQLAAHRLDPVGPWSAVEIVPWALHVCAVDPATAHAPELDALAFLIALERLRLAGYDYIVIDAPHATDSVEANLVEDAVDATLLCAVAGRSRARDLRRAVEQLTPGNLAGVIFLEA